MAVKKKSDYINLEDFNLCNETLNALRAADISGKELITLTRNYVVWHTYVSDSSSKTRSNQLTSIPGIGKSRAQEIVAAVDDLGFILHETRGSRNARRLAAAVFKTPQIFIEHYESLENLPPEALKAVDEILDSLNKREKQAIVGRFGLDGREGRIIKDYARETGVPEGKATQWLLSALTKLRSANRRAKLELAVCYPKEVLAKKMIALGREISSLQEELDSLRETSPYPELQFDLDSVPIKELDLTRRTHVLLFYAGFTMVGQLSASTDEELLSIRNFGYKSLSEVRYAIERISPWKINYPYS